MMIVSKEFEKIHKHSVILGKLITAKNSRLYLMNMIATLIASDLWLAECMSSARPLTKGSPNNTFFYIFDAYYSIFSMSKLLFLLPVLSLLLSILVSYELLVFCTAVQR